MENFIIIAIVVLMIGTAVSHIIKEKKKGVRCVGCPDGGCCTKEIAGGCNCGCGTEKNELSEE